MTPVKSNVISGGGVDVGTDVGETMVRVGEGEGNLVAVFIGTEVAVAEGISEGLMDWFCFVTAMGEGPVASCGTAAGD